jgi:hypothetical protein
MRAGMQMSLYVLAYSTFGLREELRLLFRLKT